MAAFYRGYTIAPSDDPYGDFKFKFVHKDYDGAPRDSYGPPADDRCGYADSLEEAMTQIDDIEAGREDVPGVQCPACNGEGVVRGLCVGRCPRCNGSGSARTKPCCGAELGHSPHCDHAARCEEDV